MPGGRKATNEQEFQGEVLKWINDYIGADMRLTRPPLPAFAQASAWQAIGWIGHSESEQSA
jgi:hypothetical protein